MKRKAPAQAGPAFLAPRKVRPFGQYVCATAPVRKGNHVRIRPGTPVGQQALRDVIQKSAGII